MGIVRVNYLLVYDSDGKIVHVSGGNKDKNLPENVLREPVQEKIKNKELFYIILEPEEHKDVNFSKFTRTRHQWRLINGKLKYMPKKIEVEVSGEHRKIRGSYVIAKGSQVTLNLNFKDHEGNPIKPEEELEVYCSRGNVSPRFATLAGDADSFSATYTAVDETINISITILLPGFETVSLRFCLE